MAGVGPGAGVAAMHYLGMAAMSMQDLMSYNVPLALLSVLIAIVGSTAALWAGTRPTPRCSAGWSTCSSARPGARFRPGRIRCRRGRSR